MDGMKNKFKNMRWNNEDQIALVSGITRIHYIFLEKCGRSDSGEHTGL